MRRYVVAGIALLPFWGIALAADPDLSQMNPAVMKGILPDNIPWEIGTGLDTAYLYGHPSRPGFYVLLFRWKPGNASRPHFHDQDRHLMVFSGTWWVGQGTNWDLEHATAPVKPGTYVTHYANQVHYDGARAGGEPAIEVVWGMGPVKTVGCESAEGMKPEGPCEAARRAGK